jgi:RHS repeat-associated protein
LIQYSYDGVGNLLKVRYPNQRIVEREFDVLNRLVRLKEGGSELISFVYQGLAQTGRNYRNGISMFSQLDIGRRIENMVYSKEGNLVMGYGYEWNRVGMRMVEERIHRGKLDRFSYDWKMRLINAKLGIEKNNPDLFEKQISYVLDVVDNIKKMTETKDSATTTIETEINNRNQYTRFGSLSLSYDSNGNLKQKGNKSFSYDYKNQLVKYTDPNKTVEFRYDPFGRRIQKRVELNNSQSFQITNYYYEGYRVIEERDNSERVTKQYVYGSGIDELLRMDIYQNQTPTPYYLHHNLIGSVTGITDENGNLIELVEYDPYGKPYFLKPTGNPQNPYESSESSTIGNTTLFQGREYDSETGLYYFRARYYDPELGRFLSSDPMGYQDSMNLYQAFNCNPVNFLDPLGLAKKIALILGLAPGERNVYYQLMTPDGLSAPPPAGYLTPWQIPEFSGIEAGYLKAPLMTFFEARPDYRSLIEFGKEKGFKVEVIDKEQLWKFEENNKIYMVKEKISVDGKAITINELLQDPEWAVIFVGHIVRERMEPFRRYGMVLSYPGSPFQRGKAVLIENPVVKNEIFLPLGCDSLFLHLEKGSNLTGGVWGRATLGTLEKAAVAFIKEYILSGENVQKAIASANRVLRESNLPEDRTAVIMTTNELFIFVVR